MTVEAAKGLIASPQVTWAKAYYFLYYGAAAALIPYLVIYYDMIGRSEREIGVLTGIAPLVTLVSAPIWGGYADRTGRHKSVLNIALLIATVAVTALSTVSNFMILIPIVILYAVFISPVIPLVDNSVMAMLGNARRRYGRLRLWGAIGWGISAPFVGWLIEHSGIHWSFISYVILLLTGLIVLNKLPVQSSGLTSNFWAGLRAFSLDRRWLSFLALVFMGGISLSAVSSFLFLYMNDLGSGNTIMGLALTTATVSEIPVLFFGERLLARFGSAGLLKVAMFFIGLRLIGYTLTSIPVSFLWVQLLHGLTFSAVWIAGVSYAAEIAPEGLGATAQGLFSGTVLGISAAVGSLLGGILYQAFGAVVMFRLMGSSTLLVLVLYLLVERRIMAGRAA